MTRFEFLLQAAIHIERAEPHRFRGFRSAAEALLLSAQRKGYNIDQPLTSDDIRAMLDAMDMRIASYSCCATPPRPNGLVRNPQDAAAHFLSVLTWLDAGNFRSSLAPFLEAVIQPFAPPSTLH